MVKWLSNKEFKAGNCNFTIDLTPGKERRISETDNFTLVKTKRFINNYLKIAQSDAVINNILELGIFQGGGLVLLNELFQPKKIVGIELSNVPIIALDEYILNNNSVKAYYNTSQNDLKLLNKVLQDDFNNQLDLVVDDASHLYNFTKESFEFLFPRLKPGGLYIIEDWAWSFRKPHQDPSHSWYNKPAMANLIIECFEDIATNTAIESIEVFEELAVVKKSMEANPGPLFGVKARRNREFPQL